MGWGGPHRTENCQSLDFLAILSRIVFSGPHPTLSTPSPTLRSVLFNSFCVMVPIGVVFLFCFVLFCFVLFCFVLFCFLL